EEALLVQEIGAGERGWLGGVEIFRRFALHEQSGRLLAQDREFSHKVRLGQMLQRGDEAAIGLEPLVPPAVLAGEGRGDEDLVYRRVESHPRVASRESLRVFSEVAREVRILKILEPVGDAEVA